MSRFLDCKSERSCPSNRFRLTSSFPILLLTQVLGFAGCMMLTQSSETMTAWMGWGKLWTNSHKLILSSSNFGTDTLKTHDLSPSIIILIASEEGRASCGSSGIPAFFRCSCASALAAKFSLSSEAPSEESSSASGSGTFPAELEALDGLSMTNS